MKELIKHIDRFLFAIFFGLIFTIIGMLAPNVYLQYIDKTEYVQFVQPVSFDMKRYRACDTQNALTAIKILVNTPLIVKSRLYLIRADVDNQLEIVNSYEFDTFLAVQDQTQYFWSTTKLPCGLKPGNYFYRGIGIYKIKNIEKETSFTSEVFTIIPDGDITPTPTPEPNFTTVPVPSL